MSSTNGNGHDWRNLPPVAEAEQPEVPDTPSVTFLEKHDRCDRAAMLSLRHRGGAGSHPLARGGLVHMACERVTNEVVKAWEEQRALTAEDRQRARELAAQDAKSDREADEQAAILIDDNGGARVSPEHAKDVLLEVMGENPHMQCSAKERDAARAMMHNWALGSYLRPERIIAVEQTLTLEIGGYVIRGKPDLVQGISSTAIEVVDYKTSWAMPTADEFAGTSWREGEPVGFAGDFQTELYALLIAFGTFPDGLGLPEAYEHFRLVQRFPRYLYADGIGERDAWMSRKQLVDFRFDVELQLQRLREVNTGERKWQPTPGSHCGECPAPYECPLPKHLRPDSQLADADPATLEKFATSANFMSGRASQLVRRIRKRAEQLGLSEVRIGRDLAYVFQPSESTKRKTSQAELEAAIEHAANHGAPFDFRDHYTYTESTKFTKRKVPARKNGD
jgi:hypothetical protein